MPGAQAPARCLAGFASSDVLTRLTMTVAPWP